MKADYRQKRGDEEMTNYEIALKENRDQAATIARLERELAEAKWVLAGSEKFRDAFEAAKHKMYAAGGEIAEFAFANMPCGSGPLDRAAAAVVGSQLLAKAEALDALAAWSKHAFGNAAEFWYMRGEWFCWLLPDTGGDYKIEGRGATLAAGGEILPAASRSGQEEGEAMTKKQKIQNLANRPGTEGERAAAEAALARVNAIARPITANQITAALLVEIPKRFPKVRVWRSNRIDAMAVGRGGQLRRVSAGIDGQGDLSGIAGPSGRRVEIEVKAGKDRMRPSQISFKAMIVGAGGIYVVARDVKECLRELEGLL